MGPNNGQPYDPGIVRRGREGDCGDLVGTVCTGGSGGDEEEEDMAGEVFIILVIMVAMMQKLYGDKLRDGEQVK
ncbi:hypothetical protein GH714_032374 [Hevea brasiliensis]|uniref:Uncharacterized protein n=1 Tax=Hevea brasiliensis TaxID=3981 RepID=A0A6A6KA84_HEVBR|nr:hypothetical protein GH714_032374 [Hevea brasiliensis]